MKPTRIAHLFPLVALVGVLCSCGGGGGGDSLKLSDLAGSYAGPYSGPAMPDFDRGPVEGSVAITIDRNGVVTGTGVRNGEPVQVDGQLYLEPQTLIISTSQGGQEGTIRIYSGRYTRSGDGKIHGRLTESFGDFYRDITVELDRSR